MPNWMIQSCRSAAIVLLLLSCFEASAQRIKRRSPTPAEAARVASDMAINDSLLKTGDIVVTDRGFLLYRGLAADGVAGDFVAVPNPLSTNRANPPHGR